jgi:hypothetical protein
VAPYFENQARDDAMKKLQDNQDRLEEKMQELES